MGAFSTGRFTKRLLAGVATFVAAVLAVGAPNARADEYQPGLRTSDRTPNSFMATTCTLTGRWEPSC